MSYSFNEDIFSTIHKLEKYSAELFDALPIEAQNDWAVTTPFNALQEVILRLKRQAEREAERQEAAERDYKELFECLDPIF